MIANQAGKMNCSKTAKSGNKFDTKVCWCACRGAAEGVAVVGGLMVIACAVILVVKKTNFVTSLTERWQAQPYEAVGEDGKASAPGSISLSDVRIDHDTVSDGPSSTRSRSPGRTRS